MTQNDGGGARAEEAIRQFFLRLGYFVVRNVRYRYNNEEITDIDVWAYGKGSPTHRERVVIDCKYKLKQAHVFERILWVEGLKRSLGVEHAVVATTDKRETARMFASRFQVRLIGPEILDKLIGQITDRETLTTEEFIKAVVPIDDKLIGGLRERFDHSKSLLLRLDFDAVNQHVENLFHFVQESARLQDKTMAIRLSYLSAAFFLITLDFALRDGVFLSEQRLKNKIEEGIRYGTRGRIGANAFLDSVGKKKRLEAIRLAESIRADIPADFFSRYVGTDWFIETAVALERAAYNREFMPVAMLSSPAQSVLGVLLDFLQIDRHTLFDSTLSGRRQNEEFLI